MIQFGFSSGLFDSSISLKWFRVVFVLVSFRLPNRFQVARSFGLLSRSVLQCRLGGVSKR